VLTFLYLSLVLCIQLGRTLQRQFLEDNDLCGRRIYVKTVDRGALAYIRVMGCSRHFVYRLGYQTSHTDLLPEGLHTHVALPIVGER
jgi:hypothetical protein